MLMNNNIKRIVGGGYEVKEIKYIGNTVYKKVIEKPCYRQLGCGSCQNTQGGCGISLSCNRRQCSTCQSGQCGSCEIKSQCGNTMA